MTTDHEIERVLDGWLSEGPTQPATSFLQDTMDRIDRAPRRHLAGPRTRLPAIHSGIRFAAAAAIAVALTGLAASVLVQTGGIGGRTAGSGPLPESLQAEWSPVGTPRQYPFLHGTTEGFPDLDIIISQSSITIFEPHLDIYNSALAVGDDRIELRANNTDAYSNCRVGDVGTYAFVLSSGGRMLTLTPVSDACPARATVLAGDWTRTDLGDLAPGHHVAAYVAPFVGDAGGTFSYTVPAGWAEIALVRPYSLIPRSNAREQADIRLWTDVAPKALDATCASVQPGLQRTPAAIAAWLAKLPGLVVTPPVAVRIGGLDGVMVDLSIAPGWTSPCGNGSYVSTFAIADAPPAYSVLSFDPQRRVRYVLLDRGDGSTLVIDIEAPNIAAWDAAIADAMSIVDSFEFTR